MGSLLIEIKPYEETIIGTDKLEFNPSVLESNENAMETQSYDVYLYISPDRAYIEPVLKPISQ